MKTLAALYDRLHAENGIPASGDDPQAVIRDGRVAWVSPSEMSDAELLAVAAELRRLSVSGTNGQQR